MLIPCDDPGALSSINEGESRHFARLVEVPLLEPGDFQEAKDMVKWAFELSRVAGHACFVRETTRLAHTRGKVILGELPKTFPVPVLVVQHMPELFTCQLARSLAMQCQIGAREVVHGDSVTPGLIHLARGDHHIPIRLEVRLCAKRPVSAMVMESIADGIEDVLTRQAGVEVPSERIGELVMDALRPLDRVAYVRYASVYRNFQDIGEFQEFVDELETRQRQELQARNQVELPLSQG